MLPISHAELPDSPEKLQEELAEGFTKHGIAARDIQVGGRDVRSLESLKIDLSGANITRSVQAPNPRSTNEVALSIKAVEITARPIYLEGVPGEFAISGEEMGFAIAPTDGYALLVPVSAAKGKVEVELTRAALEQLLQKVATEAASKQGVEIQETHLEFTSTGDRALKFRADVVGKVFLMKAPVSLTGEMSIDDDLNLHLSNLTVGGSGMIANLANGFAQPFLKKAQAAPISLTMFSLGSLKLRDIRLSAGESLRLEAQFGS